MCRKYGTNQKPAATIPSSFSFCFFFSLQEQHLVQLEEASQLVEARYRHFFDRLFVYQETQEAIEELASIIQEAQEKAQWCPVSWRHSHQ